MPKKYNTPHRNVTVKTRLTKEECLVFFLGSWLLEAFFGSLQDKLGQSDTFVLWHLIDVRERHWAKWLGAAHRSITSWLSRILLPPFWPGLLC